MYLGHRFTWDNTHAKDLHVCFMLCVCVRVFGSVLVQLSLNALFLFCFRWWWAVQPIPRCSWAGGSDGTAQQLFPSKSGYEIIHLFCSKMPPFTETKHLIYMNNYAVIDVVLRLWVSNTLLLCWRVPFNYILISNFIIAVIHHFCVTFKRLSSSLLPTQDDFTFFLVFSFFPPFYMS